MLVFSEVIRVKGLAVGYLLSKAKHDNNLKDTKKGAVTRKSSKGKPKSKPSTSPSSPSGSPKSEANTPHWIVSVEGGSGDEEVIAESLLGKVLQEVESSDESAQSATVDKQVVTATTMAKTAAANKGKVAIAAAAPATKGNSNKGKSKTKTPDGAPKTTSPPPKAHPSSKIAGNGIPSSPEREILEWERKRPVPRPKKLDGDYDHVEEVHLNTGTLFLYRGAKRRRVEYVQRV
jgi:hypothetical protein